MNTNDFPFLVERGEGCPSVDQLLLSLVPGELSKEDEAELEQHLTSCSRCAQRKQELQQERERFYKKHPSLEVVQSDSAPWWLSLRPPMMVAASSLVLLIFVGVWMLQGPPRGPGPGIQFKGSSPSLFFVVEREGTVFRGSSPIHLREGDRIRFAYSLEEKAYLFIVNVDNGGKVTAYYPLQGKRSLLLESGKEIFLDGSIRLDEYVGKERIFALFSRESLPLNHVEEVIHKEWQRLHSQAKDVEALETIPIKGYQQSFLIIKEARDEKE